MAQPYVGEIRIFAGTFAPVGWNFCDGSSLVISQYEALFNLIGTTYGGNGVTNFNVPDLRGRVPLHNGTNAGVAYPIGQISGTESVTLTVGQMPGHTHTVLGSSTGNSATPTNNTYGNGQLVYSSAVPSVAMSPLTVANAGGSLPHENLMPFQCINYIIALFGIYPTQ